MLARRRPLDDALAASDALARLDARDRAFARLLVATTLRRLGEIDRLIEARLERALPRGAARVRDVLRTGVAQIVFLGTPAHAAVNESVELLRATRHAGYRGLVNALLRRIAGESRGAATDGAEAGRTDTPDWLWRSWEAAYGEATARAIAAAHLGEPPLDITVKADPELWAARLEAEILPTGSLRRRPAPVDELPGFAEGAWWVQDAAAALPARVLLAAAPDGGRGLRVADLCAAPGGKTAQLAAAGARVTALDVSGARLERLAANLARLGLAAELVEADLRHWTPAEPFDAVLLDAPCSGTGTIRRHPDIARIKAPADVVRMAALQRDLLDAAAARVRPGGVLVYAVCSLQPEEGPAVVDGFLAANEGFAIAPVAPGEIAGIAPFLTERGEIRTLPCQWPEHGGLDGFHVSRLKRRA